MQPSNVTERQRQWFDSVRASLAASTGRSLEDWTRLAADCPETAHRRRLAWMKATHGLGQNYASLVLGAAFPPAASWSEPDDLAAALWTDPAARAIFERIRVMAAAMPDVIVGQRKAFTAFSRNVQFAAARPVKSTVRLGLAMEPAEKAALVPAGRESWSERLHAVLVLDTPEQVDGTVAALLGEAWERS
jgi:hypothetical protein